jgi:hypothetical protein
VIPARVPLHNVKTLHPDVCPFSAGFGESASAPDPLNDNVVDPDQAGHENGAADKIVDEHHDA